MAYVLQHDNTAKIPMWVSFVVTPAHATGCVPRSNAFAPDNSLPKGSRAEVSDYARSGYDTGHIGNDNLMSWSLIPEYESFILSNMCPQVAGFNRGVWKMLETAIMDWAVERNHSLLIYAGPIYNVDTDDKIGKSDVDVPTGFYKIVIDLTTNEVMAYIFPHSSIKYHSFAPFMTTTDEIFAKTGIVFPLPPNAVASTVVWPYTTKEGAADKKTVCSIH
jgi:endonuclease G